MPLHSKQNSAPLTSARRQQVAKWDGLMLKLMKAAFAGLSLLGCTLAWAGASEDLHALLDEHWARVEQEQVYFRTDPDAFRPRGELASFSPEARKRRQDYNDDVLARLAKIDESKLGGQDRISYKLFRYERLTERESYRFYDHRFPITRLFGYHTYFAAAPGAMNFANERDYRDFLVSLADFPRYNREHIALLEEAVSTGYTQYCESMAGYEKTISVHLPEDVESSALFAPFLDMPSTIPADTQKELRKQGRKLVAEAVLPAYRELYAFYTTQYQPNCRKEPGITSLPGGEDYYRYLLRYFTTTDMSPQEIHDLGLSETRRIRAEMDAIIESSGFDGDFRAFLDFLRSDPQFYADSEQALVERVSYIAKRADGAMPKFFGKLARNTYHIVPTHGRGAFYMSGDLDKGIPGAYYMSLANLDAKPLYNLEALTLHEAVPGHHHQTALAMELDLPEFRRIVYHSAYGEGWGLYSERLGKEMGFYQDPYSDFGRLTYEMWRANRLVVDTGLHAFGWSRQRAIDYLLANSALSEAEVVAEVDRYITWPGQATSYKIGELRILALRERVEQQLGERFDIRAFHDVVVGNGSVAIDILDEIVDEWLAEQVASE